MPLDNNKQIGNDKKKDPTCFKCDSINYCTVGRVSELDNCPMKIYPDMQEQAKELYKNDEFVGGILRYYNDAREPSVKMLLDQTLSGIKDLLISDSVLIAYYDSLSHKPCLISAPISGGMIEVLIENSHLCPDLAEIAFNSLDMWISSPSFEQHGLFLSKHHIRSELWNKAFLSSKLPIFLKLQNRIGVNFFLNGRWNNSFYKFPFGIKSSRY